MHHSGDNAGVENDVEMLPGHNIAASREPKSTDLSRETSENRKPLQGAPGRPDPFSTAWREGAVRGARGDTEAEADEDVVVVDDFTQVGDASYIPLDGDMMMIKKSSTDIEEDGAGDEEDASDGEWEFEQLRRAGHSLRREDDEGISRDVARGMVQAADEGFVPRSDGFNKLLLGVKQAKQEWKGRMTLAEDKVKRLDEAEREGDAICGDVDKEIERERKRFVFYDGVAAHVDEVVDMLDTKRTEILAARKRALERLEREWERVRRRLLGGVDEFGRVRQGCLDINSEESEGEDGVGEEDVYEDVADDVRSISTLVKLFRRWLEEFPDEYEQAFGDKGLGMLAGRMALGLVKDMEMRWMEAVENKPCAKREALRVAKGDEFLAAVVRARWRPRERGHGARYAGIGRVVAEACGTEVLKLAFKERVELEVGACRREREWAEVGKCFVGSVDVVRVLGWDFGIAGVVDVLAEDRGGTAEPEVVDAVRWVVGEGRGVVQADAVVSVEKILAGRMDGGHS